MSLVFKVANAKDVFFEDYAGKVNAFLLERFRQKPKDADPYYAEEIAWDGWYELQEFAHVQIEVKKFTHFLSMGAGRLRAV
ncbi:hypothetical protein [Leptospira santarosai]|uniref:hypothetical protein n=1 Tax=Leptospira santarosai TaxID=28183 RepID=UPI0002D96878|nr:hypothetical protein [Leptospira santarosai]